LLPNQKGLADPDKDKEGKILAMAREPKRAYQKRKLDNDF